MIRSVFATSALLAAILGVTAEVSARAKPADLPAARDVACPECEPGEQPTVRSDIEASKPAVSAIDTLSPALMTVYLQEFWRHVQHEVMGQAQQYQQAVVEAVRQGALAVVDGAPRATRPEAVDPAESAEPEESPQTNQPEQTARVRELRNQMSQPISLNFKDIPFREAIREVSAVSGVAIELDRNALADHGVNLDSPVTLVVEDLSLTSVLHLMLDRSALTWELRDGVVTIVPQARNQGRLPQQRNLNQAAVDTREREARQLFKIAEDCRHRRDFDRARTCYQQVHRLAPTSRLGQMAMDRLQEIEQRMLDPLEESEPEVIRDPEQTFRNIRRWSIPLGLVEITY
jgi:hypothetical protein